MTRARRTNPVPQSKHVQIKDALRLFAEFSGHKGELFSTEKPSVPDVCMVVGLCDGIMYETVRDGKTEKYLHQFKASSRPLLLASHDGKQLILLGGAYDFTERGIVDKPRKT